MEDKPNTDALLLRIAQELKDIRQLVMKAVNAMHEAEGEIPEKMRRFTSYYHNIVHLKGEYLSLGIPSPAHIDREMERCDDRFRQLLIEQHTDGGTFEKVRRVMAEDPENRWDHTRLLSKPKENL